MNIIILFLISLNLVICDNDSKKLIDLKLDEIRYDKIAFDNSLNYYQLKIP